MKKIGTLSAVMALWTLAATPADGTEPTSDHSRPGWLHEIYVGLLAHDVDGLWSGDRREEGVDFNAEIVLNRPGFSLPAGSVRPNFGLSVNDHGDTSKLYGGLLWQLEMTSDIFLNLGVGAAVHNGEKETGKKDKKALGSRILFRIPIELGYTLNKHHRLSIAFDHVSNGYLTHPNEGLDTLGLRYSYRF